MLGFCGQGSFCFCLFILSLVPIHGPLDRLPESPEASDDWLSPGCDPKESWDKGLYGLSSLRQHISSLTPHSTP